MGLEGNINPIVRRTICRKPLAQKTVYMLLKELGGKARLDEIKDLAKKRYPGATQWHYAISDLKRLAKWGYVEYASDGTWVIKEELGY